MSAFRQHTDMIGLRASTDPYQRAKSRALAVAIGVLLAWALVAWWGA